MVTHSERVDMRSGHVQGAALAQGGSSVLKEGNGSVRMYVGNAVGSQLVP